ncbi:hypothetical protein SmJEL517_g03678 [Synchytrium microbalum]|uniref:RING-type domain-containing protein n=1 Tax=Synchytrium microbalum TaxID=1806994 RepID=A0A507C7F5_9FUNG|nr:uncharacterized protein SmJEL517_g03678 [Synchytrium microbalum]TPX33463.1 hypothetical protein SmJEL517_g03678 [Synchytrium microbalum]
MKLLFICITCIVFLMMKLGECDVMPYLTISYMGTGQDGLKTVTHQLIYKEALAIPIGSLNPPRKGITGQIVDFGPSSNSWTRIPPNGSFIATFANCMPVNPSVLQYVVDQGPAALLFHSYGCAQKPAVTILPSSMNICALVLDDVVARPVLAMIPAQINGTVGGIPDKVPEESTTPDRVASGISIGLVIVYSIVLGSVLVGVCYICSHLARARCCWPRNDNDTNAASPLGVHHTHPSDRARRDDAMRLNMGGLLPQEWRKMRIDTLPIMIYSATQHRAYKLPRDSIDVAEPKDRKDSACQIDFAPLSKSEVHDGRHDEKLDCKEDEKDDAVYEQDACCICIEDYKDGDKLRELLCGHYFHIQCIDPWLSRDSPFCPLCKADTLTPRRSVIFEPTSPSIVIPILEAGQEDDGEEEVEESMPAAPPPSAVSSMVDSNDTVAHTDMATAPVETHHPTLLQQQPQGLPFVPSLSPQRDQPFTHTRGHTFPVFPTRRWRAYVTGS